MRYVSVCEFLRTGMTVFHNTLAVEFDFGAMSGGLPLYFSTPFRSCFTKQFTGDLVRHQERINNEYDNQVIVLLNPMKKSILFCILVSENLHCRNRR
jgi:hypothetical protein